MTKRTQIVMDHTGDSRHEFDAADAAAVSAAEKRFEELVGAGFTAAERTGAGTSRVVRKFDAAAKEVIFVPRLQGG